MSGRRSCILFVFFRILKPKKEAEAMKEDEKKTPVAWEAKDPELPIIHSDTPGTRADNHRR